MILTHPGYQSGTDGVLEWKVDFYNGKYPPYSKIDLKTLETAEIIEVPNSGW